MPLPALLETISQCVSTRTPNPFGLTVEGRVRIAADLTAIEPLLRADATVKIDTRLPLGDVVGRILAHSGRSRH